MQGEKKCSKCKLIKPYSEFYENNDTKLGLSSACKECERKSSKARRKYIEYKCEDCGSTFTRRSDHKNTKYCNTCSKKRVADSQRGKILEKARKGSYVKCDNCEKEHYKRLSQLKLGHTHYFCGQECQGIWSAKHYVPNKFITSADNSGVNNGRYKHGKRIGGHDRHKKLKKQIIARDGEGCLICKSKEHIHVHRIMPGALGGKYELDNTVFLCNIHHAAVHKDYELWKDKLSKMVSA